MNHFEICQNIPFFLQDLFSKETILPEPKMPGGRAGPNFSSLWPSIWGKGIVYFQTPPAILSYLRREWLALRSTGELHSPVAQVDQKTEVEPNHRTTECSLSLHTLPLHYWSSLYYTVPFPQHILFTLQQKITRHTKRQKNSKRLNKY